VFSKGSTKCLQEIPEKTEAILKCLQGNRADRRGNSKVLAEKIKKLAEKNKKLGELLKKLAELFSLFTGLPCKSPWILRNTRRKCRRRALSSSHPALACRLRRGECAVPGSLGWGAPA
jgi:hypothetical protein